ncbi:VOC family protein [Pseudonocardia spirodelae]|uniref:VOC family protein n=1 Tax=Pseudonocardia spirodelae TaxID=3133431 RepID=A0ABU8TDD9_9PSEU
MKPITPCLWFDGVAEEAARFYTGIFPDSGIDAVLHYGPEVPDQEGQVLTVSFRINGQPCTALNGGPMFTFSEAISMEVHCESVEEVDRYWAALTEGGSEQPCGWLKDRYGLSWQVVPPGLLDWLSSPDTAARSRVASAVFATHGKLDAVALEKAFRG